MWQAVNARILVPASQPRATSNFQSLLLGCFAGIINFIDFAPRRARNIFELDAGVTFETQLQINNKTCLGSCARVMDIYIPGGHSNQLSKSRKAFDSDERSRQDIGSYW